MKKRLRYKRVAIVFSIMFFLGTCFIYMYTQRRYDREYLGDIETYTAIYKEEDKLYTFDLKSFEEHGNRYVSLNDIYNVVKILDTKTKVFINHQSHTMTYQLDQKEYLFDYGHDKIVYNNKCIEFNNKYEHIYVSHKNIYISVFLTEKLLLNNEKTIVFKNKNAIIQ